MCKSAFILLPCALLAACTPPPPSLRPGSNIVCAGADSVAQQFYDAQSRGKASLTNARPWLAPSLYQQLQEADASSTRQSLIINDTIFFGDATTIDNANVNSTSDIPDEHAKNMPLRVTLHQGMQTWQNEVLMTHDGQCWVIDDIRYLGKNSQMPTGSLRQFIEKK